MSRNRPSFSAVPVAEDLAGLTRARRANAFQPE